MPTRASSISCGGGHARHERELRVPVFHGEQAPPLELIAAVGAHDLGLGRVQARAAAGPFLLDAQQADLPQQRERPVDRAGVDAALRLDVAQSLARAHDRPLEPSAHDRAGLVEVELPQIGASVDAGQQRDAILAEHRRMQRNPAVGGVQRLPAHPRLLIDGALGDDEPRDIRDRIVHRVAAFALREVQGLIEIHRAWRVDRDELEIAQVAFGRRRSGCRGLGLGEYLGRELRGQFERRAQVCERGGEFTLRS